MAIEQLALDVLFGMRPAPTTWFVGLANGPKELDVVGYERVRVRRGEWVQSPGKAQATVRFGPFDEGTIFDTTLLFAGDSEVAQILIVGAPVRTVAGMGLEHHVEVTDG